MEFESPIIHISKSRVDVMVTLQCKYYKNDEWKVKDRGNDRIEMPIYGS